MKKTLFLFPIIALTIFGCDGGTLPGIPDENLIVDTLNEGIVRLESGSESWQNVLKETRDKLIEEGQSSLANEVSNTLSRATSDIGIEAKCYTDFLRDRTREELIKLRATITKEKLQLKPVFCNPTPDSINMNLPQNRRTNISIAGYNLTRDAIKVFLEDTQNRKTDVSDSIDNPSNYKLTVTLDRIPLNKTSKRLIFELANGTKHSIGIIKAYKPPKQEFRLSRIRITGDIYMNDDEIFKDENKKVPINTYIDIPGGSNKTYSWQGCVGDEVQGYLDVQMQLDKDTGTITGQGSATYYEGTKCGRTDLHKSRNINSFSIRPNQSHPIQIKLSDSEGEVNYNLNFKNEIVKKVLVPQ
ncbi:MAG: hypothetical protein WBA39_10810 [Rivularia sp. (in: cyanobacteria)]